MRTGPGFDGSDGSDCVWLALCPWDARLTRLDPATLRVIVQDAKVDGTNCVMIRNEWSTCFWLDRARDFIVLRKQEVDTGNGADQSRVDFSYRPDANYGWVPTGWREIRVGWNYGLEKALDDTVQKVTFNRPIPAATFAIEFPQGAYVNDFDPEPLREERRGSRRTPRSQSAGRRCRTRSRLPGRITIRNSMRGSIWNRH